MEKKLQLLETFPVHGDDGKDYVVHGYEHLARLGGGTDLLDPWQSTGIAEYKLADGEPVNVDRSGVMTIARSGVRLTRERAVA